MYKPALLAALLAASCGAQAAADADLAAIRAQIADLKKNYEQRIAALEQKLAQAEARAPIPVPVAAEVRPQVVASSFNPEVSLILQGQYRKLKDVPERAITGFAAAGGHEHGDAASRRGFGIGHSELVLAANIDPYWRGQAIVAMQDGEAEVEEAWFQSLGLGHGLGLKGGRFRSGIGYLNEQHPHQQDFADVPLSYRAMFGGEGSYGQDGLQLKWLAPLETFVEFGAEFGRGANFPGSDRNRNGSGASALFVHLGGDLGVAHSWRAGLSYLKTAARDRASHFEDVINGGEATGSFAGDSRTLIADFVWKWAPDGNPKYRNFKLQGEYLQRRERGELACGVADGGEAVSCDGLVDAYRTRQSGWYAQGVYQFTPNWRAGLRYERLDSGRRDFGAIAGYLAVDAYRPQKSTAMIDYSWSEFSRVRLQFARDQAMQGIVDNQLTLQYIMSLGAHGAHKF